MDKFIEWKVDKAEGFEIKVKNGAVYIKCPNLIYYEIIFFNNNDLNVESVYSPLLLQKALEGCTAYEIKIDNDYLTIYDIYKIPKIFCIGESINEAKEQALKYIYEQEKKA